VASAVDTLPPPRLGLVKKFFLERADGPVRRAVEATLARLRDAGAQITPVEPNEDFDAMLDVHTAVMAIEAAAWHRQQFAAHRDQYGPNITGLLDRGLAISGVDYADALARLRHFRRHAAEMLAGVDALIAPATDTTAPPTRDTTGPKTFQAPWSCSGLPVVSMPCGLADDGMPAAVQLVGRPDGDWPLLGTARWCEKQIDFRDRPPLLEA
jgi:aspartyl-tRNA(Asn)/glutamyl-tRNA(Gln) amidotransferase subunit A